MPAYIGNTLVGSKLGNLNTNLIVGEGQYTVYNVSLQGCNVGVCDDISTATITIPNGSITIGNYYTSPNNPSGVFRVDSGPVTSFTPPDYTNTIRTDITGNQDTYCCA